MKFVRRLPAVLPALAAALLLSPTLAEAHPGHGGGYSVIGGVFHPFAGADHLAAMVSVGLWAALAGGRRIWAWPVAFIAAMIAGAMLGHAGVAFPAVEPAIAASVVILGLCVATGVAVPLVPGALLVGAFALFHGHAHGMEAPASGWAGYVAGFAFATAILHGIGIAFGVHVQKIATALPARAVGAAVTGLGIVLLVR